MSQDYGRVENNAPNPVVVDLDGDGELEILFPSCDGRMHAYWLDKTQYGSWPYAVTKPGEGFIRFASEPAVADLDDDGKAEVIFASWVEKDTYRTGKLHILSYLGEPIWEVDLPAAFGSPSWNGALAAPTLANIDGDLDLEVVLNTAHSGLVAYDLPGSAVAQVLWGTGKGSYQRSGSLVRGDLSSSRKLVDRLAAQPGETLTFTLRLRSTGLPVQGVTLSDRLPAGISYLGRLEASTGTAPYASGVVSWVGDISPAAPVTVRFQALVSPELDGTLIITNRALLEDSEGGVWELLARVLVNGRLLYLPVVQ
ncbi:MAG: FG-GAP-like repeat-containing protein [Anaerolineales bacterium]